MRVYVVDDVKPSPKGHQSGFRGRDPSVGVRRRSPALVGRKSDARVLKPNNIVMVKV